MVPYRSTPCTYGTVSFHIMYFGYRIVPYHVFMVPYRSLPIVSVKINTQSTSQTVGVRKTDKLNINVHTLRKLRIIKAMTRRTDGRN